MYIYLYSRNIGKGQICESTPTNSKGNGGLAINRSCQLVQNSSHANKQKIPQDYKNVKKLTATTSTWYISLGYHQVGTVESFDYVETDINKYISSTSSYGTTQYWLSIFDNKDDHMAKTGLVFVLMNFTQTNRRSCSLKSECFLQVDECSLNFVIRGSKSPQLHATYAADGGYHSFQFYLKVSSIRPLYGTISWKLEVFSS